MKRRRGLTMIEMLVSLALLAVILVICYALLADTLDGDQTVRRQIDFAQTADGIRDLLATDLNNILMPEAQSAGNATGHPTAGPTSTQSQDAPAGQQAQGATASPAKEPPLTLARGPAGLSELAFAVACEPVEYAAANGGPTKVSYALQP